MNEQEYKKWQAARRRGIGGSDIAAIMGLSPYKTRLDVWREKRGLAEPFEGNAATDWGKILEPVVADKYAATTDRIIVNWGQQIQHEDPSLYFMLANIDRAVVNLGMTPVVSWKPGKGLTTDRILEVKTAGFHSAHMWGEPGTDQIPDHFLLQCQWYLEVTGTQICDVAVLIGGQDFRIYTVERNEDLIREMIAAAIDFWACVEAGIEPEPQSLAECQARWQKADPGKSVIVGVDVVEAIAQIEEIKAAIDELQEEQERLKTEVIKAFEDAEEITHQGVKLATYKNSKQPELFDRKLFEQEHPELAKKYTYKGQSARKFLISKKKGA